MEMNFRQKKGITLIALVITIIVLLILAGVTIATLTGDNGLLTKTSKANLETRGASVEERKDLWKTEQNTDNYVEGDTAQSLDELLNELEKEGLITPEERIQIEENGNEYVWIEVPKSITQTANTKEELYNVLNEYSIDYKDTWDWGMDNSDIWYEGCGMTEEEYNDNYMKMLNSIKENGGFYIGRYEMGSIESRTESSDITQSGVKKDMYPYNWVTMEEAQNICETYSLGDRTSSLMYDIQYNLACKFLEVKSDYAKDFGSCEEGDGSCEFDKDDELVIGYGSDVDADDYVLYPLPDLGYGYNGNIYSTDLRCSGNTNEEGTELLNQSDRKGCKIYDFRINNVIVSTDENIFSFYVGFYHPDLDTRYGIDIVCPINYF